jgi:hypothetical protein
MAAADPLPSVTFPHLLEIKGAPSERQSADDRCWGGAMILEWIENKYGFDMRVSLCAIDTYRHHLWLHTQSVFVSRLAFGELGAAHRPRALTPIRCETILLKRKPTMIDAKFTRRGFAATAATGLAALGLFGATVEPASAEQGNMERAIGSLHEALSSLQESTANKGGHRGRAMELVRQAIAETQAGIDFADEHGGGGR